VALHNTYPILLKRAGYTIGFVGKYGVGKPGEQPKHLYDFWDCSSKIQPDYEMKDDSGNYLHHTDKVAGDVKRFLDQMGSREPLTTRVNSSAARNTNLIMVMSRSRCMKLLTRNIGISFRIFSERIKTSPGSGGRCGSLRRKCIRKV
jgi:hypothetical protein